MYFVELKKESFYQYKTGVKESNNKIGEVEKKIEVYENKLSDY